MKTPEVAVAVLSCLLAGLASYALVSSQRNASRSQEQVPRSVVPLGV